MKDRRARPAGERGFTLIETVMVIVLLGIVGAAVLLPFITTLRGSADPVLTQQGNFLAQGELDQVIADKRQTGGFAALPTGTGLVCATAASMPTGFTCSRDICFVPAGNLNDTSACGTTTGYRRVEARVALPGGGTVSAVTLVGDF